MTHLPPADSALHLSSFLTPQQVATHCFWYSFPLLSSLLSRHRAEGKGVSEFSDGRETVVDPVLRGGGAGRRAPATLDQCLVFTAASEAPFIRSVTHCWRRSTPDRDLGTIPDLGTSFRLLHDQCRRLRFTAPRLNESVSVFRNKENLLHRLFCTSSFLSPRSCCRRFARHRRHLINFAKTLKEYETTTALLTRMSIRKEHLLITITALVRQPLEANHKVNFVRSQTSEK